TTDTDQTFTDIYFDIPSWLKDGDEDEKVLGGSYYLYATIENDETIVARVEFEVEAVASITSISPNSGTVGTEVEVFGEGYDAAEDIIVEFDGTAVSIAGGDTETDSNGDFEDTKFIVPASSAGAHTITVTGDDSDLEAEITFTVTPKITVTPESGASGTSITVTGTGFAEGVVVTIYFDDSAKTQADSDSNGSFTATFPAPVIAEGLYIIEALDANSNSGEDGFSIGTATLTLVPNEGNIGDTVAVTGTGFIANTAITVTFDTTVVATATSDASGGLSTSFTVPSVTVGDYGVIADDGTNAAGKRFNISTSTDISPVTSASSPGNVGTSITVSGMGFTPSQAVRVTYDGTEVGTSTVTASGDFSVSFDAPASTAGSHSIVATQGVNTQTFTFYMESTAPAIPPHLLPETETKADAETFIDWDDVTDPSGVTYSLQIATGANFTGDSLVLEKTGLIESEYTLTREERLNSVSEEAPYYWRVKAMDNASNESSWSSASTFFVGFSFSMPQPIIYLIIGICAVLLAGFAFWMGRKTAYY
ncbi:IPT/TIG domain-containing protein, partial [Chloroflexota bacterium]